MKYARQAGQKEANEEKHENMVRPLRLIKRISTRRSGTGAVAGKDSKFVTEVARCLSFGKYYPSDLHH